MTLFPPSSSSFPTTRRVARPWPELPEHVPQGSLPCRCLLPSLPRQVCVCDRAIRGCHYLRRSLANMPCVTSLLPPPASTFCTHPHTHMAAAHTIRHACLHMPHCMCPSSKKWLFFLPGGNDSSNGNVVLCMVVWLQDVIFKADLTNGVETWVRTTEPTWVPITQIATTEGMRAKMAINGGASVTSTQAPLGAIASMTQGVLPRAALAQGRHFAREHLNLIHSSSATIVVSQRCSKKIPTPLFSRFP